MCRKRVLLADPTCQTGNHPVKKLSLAHAMFEQSRRADSATVEIAIHNSLIHSRLRGKPSNGLLVAFQLRTTYRRPAAAVAYNTL
jgi:hypothetical protein